MEHYSGFRYSKSPAQILLRWAVQNGFITIPKSVKPHRIIENSQVFDWTLKDEDFNALVSMISEEKGYGGKSGFSSFCRKDDAIGLKKISCR